MWCRRIPGAWELDCPIVSADVLLELFETHFGMKPGVERFQKNTLPGFVDGEIETCKFITG